MYDLKGFRQAFNLTQKQLAEILKCQQSNISGMEKTMRDLEPIQKKRLEEAYGSESVAKFVVSSFLESTIMIVETKGYGRLHHISSSHVSYGRNTYGFCGSRRNAPKL